MNHPPQQESWEKMFQDRKDMSLHTNPNCLDWRFCVPHGGIETQEVKLDNKKTIGYIHWLEEKLSTERQRVLDEVRELVETNQKGQFEDDGGNIGWYLDDLLLTLKEFERLTITPTQS